jgi:hypothetical protein
MIMLTETVNCITTNILRAREAWRPALKGPFSTFIGLNPDK